MKQTWRVALLMFVGFAACTSHKPARALSFAIPHPDDPTKKVEYFLETPGGKGPWPTVVFLHGHQDSPRSGGHDFVKWGVLDDFADRGYLAVAVSQPGYGNSTGGPADFCGPYTQDAVAAVIAKLRKDGLVADNRIVLEGVSRGALVAGLVAARDPSIRGIVLISGLYDLPKYALQAKSPIARSIVDAMDAETNGTAAALKARSLIYHAQNLKAEALILNGAKDERTDPTQAEELAAEINAHHGHAKAVVYPDYGHQIPVEVRNREVQPFIERVLLP
jgi:dipeptidyl aminopeptidase/acylaminoacyl peptidase